MCWSLQGETSVHNVYFTPRFLTHSVSLKAPRMPCKNWAPADVPARSWRTQRARQQRRCCGSSPFFFLSLLFFFKRLFVCASPSLEHENPRLCESCVRSEVTHCPPVHAPPPLPSHFMQLSHSTAFHRRSSSPFSSTSREQRGLVRGVAPAYRVRWPYCLGWVARLAEWTRSPGYPSAHRAESA